MSGRFACSVGGRVRALRRTPVSGGANLEAVLTTGETAGDLLNTLEYNLMAPAGDQLPVRALIGTLDPSALPLFRTQLGKRADGLLEVLDLFMRSHGPGTVVREKATRASNWARQLLRSGVPGRNLLPKNRSNPATQGSLIGNDAFYF